MSGIKETQELISLIATSAAVLKAAKADGSIDYKDLTKLGPMIGALKAAVDGAKDVGAELKELSSEEITALLIDTVAAVKSLVDAVIS
ncbi:hypothetical protein UFOVP901_19 [uncultured Caudovirales phage]|jgi:hypothetical protein|uniref:Uncharacterized protein n=1 Tax=uncultured Caudovirales phage TaxID=2100421 RepID=A0A6J5PL81_9CAUD|nr:hypothetical protein UFOVP901_19 [uncultured Caudovirales phage]